MTNVDEERNILKHVKDDINKAKDRDEVNKIYRQARIWNRFHHFYANACSYDMYTFLNRKFKSYRNEALRTIK